MVLEWPDISRCSRCSSKVLHCSKVCWMGLEQSGDNCKFLGKTGDVWTSVGCV